MAAERVGADLAGQVDLEPVLIATILYCFWMRPGR